MKNNSIIGGVACALWVILLFSGCTREQDEPERRADGKVRISFSIPAIADETPSTRGELKENTTIRVIAYLAGSTTYIAEQAYYMNGGKLKPCTVNADGAFEAVDNENELALIPDKYDFYSITPALPLNADKKTVTVPNGVDYASSVNLGVTVKINQTLALNQLARKCAKIKLEIKKSGDNTAMTALKLNPSGNGVTFSALPATASGVPLNTDIPAANGTATLNIPASVFTLNGTTSTSTTYLLPRLGTNRMKIDYDLTYTVSGTSESKTVSGTMGNTVLEKGKSYTFTLTMRKTGASLTVIEWIENNQEVITGESFDYSIDGSSGFLLSSGDMKNPDPAADIPTRMNWYIANGVYDATYNINTLKGCPVGWRLPTQKEQSLLWAYNGAIPAKYSLGMEQYCSSTEGESTKSWSFYFKNGAMQGYPKTNTFCVRCVRGLAPSTNSAQRVVLDDGKIIIDSRNVRPEGITSKKKALTTNWKDNSSSLTSGLGDIASPESNDQVYYYFEVGKSDSDGGKGFLWLDAINKCASLTDDGGGWRLPTQRELMLMWIFKTELGSKSGFSSFTSNYYWSATEYSHNASGDSGWWINFGNGYTNITSKTTQSVRVRCVRDVQ